MSVLRGNGWSKVPPGELGRLGARLRLRRLLTSFLLPAALVLGAAVTITGVTWVATDPDLWASSTPQPYQGCRPPTTPTSCHDPGP
jgi:hypothetical protein